MTKYLLDANLYIDAIRSVSKAGELEAFYYVFLPYTYLHAIVAHELLRGATDERRIPAIHAAYIEPFEARGRLVTPTFTSWTRAGEVIAILSERTVIEPDAVSRSFVHDVLLAVSCREAGMTLITRNHSDFERIRRVERFDFVAPWPTR